MLAVNRVLDPNTDDVPHVKKFIQEFKLKMPVALNGKDKNDVDAAFGMIGSPTTVLIGADGKVVDAWEGFDEKRLMAALAKVGYQG